MEADYSRRLVTFTNRAVWSDPRRMRATGEIARRENCRSFVFPFPFLFLFIFLFPPRWWLSAPIPSRKCNFVRVISVAITLRRTPYSVKPDKDFYARPCISFTDANSVLFIEKCFCQFRIPFDYFARRSKRRRLTQKVTGPRINHPAIWIRGRARRNRHRVATSKVVPLCWLIFQQR